MNLQTINVEENSMKFRMMVECEEFAKSDLIHPIISFMNNIDEIVFHINSIEKSINTLQLTLNLTFKTPYITSEKLSECIIEVESIYRNIESDFSSVHLKVMELLYEYRTREIMIHPSGFQQKVRFNYNLYIQSKIQNMMNYYDIRRYELLNELWRFIMIEICEIEEDKSKISEIIHVIKEDIIENINSSEENVIENNPIKKEHYYCIKDMIYFYLTIFRLLNIELYNMNDYPLYENNRSFSEISQMFIRYRKCRIKKERKKLLELGVKYRKTAISGIITFCILIFVVGSLLVVLLM